MSSADNVVHLRPAVPEKTDGENPRKAYSFDITQTDARGLVLIDACVPMELAIKFMALIAEHKN